MGKRVFFFLRKDGKRVREEQSENTNVNFLFCPLLFNKITKLPSTLAGVQGRY